MFATLFLSLLAGAWFQASPAAWKVLKDSKSICRIEVPPDWEWLAETAGAAIYQSPATAIAVVTSQPGQDFKPLPENVQRLMGIRKDKVFENSARRVFYQDRISRGPEDANGYSASVPGKNGTCSCHITVTPVISEETAKKIALSLGPVQ